MITRVTTAKELTAALKNALPGADIVLADGVYAGGFKLVKSGKDGSPITIRAEHPGSAFLLGGVSCLNIQASSWIVLTGLVFDMGTDYGLRTGGVSHLTVNGCVAMDCGVTGFFLGSTSHVTLNDCEAYGSKEQHGCYWSAGGVDFTVNGGRYHCNNKAGIQLNGPNHPKTVRLNAVSLSGNNIDGTGAALNVLETQDVEAKGCLINGNLFQGVSCNGSTVKIIGCEIKFKAGEGGKCLNIGNGSTVEMSGSTLQMGVHKSPPPEHMNVRPDSTYIDGGGNAILPVAVVEAK